MGSTTFSNGIGDITFKADRTNGTLSVNYKPPTGGTGPTAGVTWNVGEGTVSYKSGLASGNGNITINGNVTSNPDGGFTATGKSVSLSWKGPGGAEIGVKLTPNGMVPHPTDPSAPMVPSAKAEGIIGFKKFSLDIPLDDNFTMNDLFDRELNGPLSSGLLGDAYTKLLHRKRDLDQAIEDTENGIDPNTNRNFNRARNFRAARDPLVLDLDGDGIETVGADTGEVLFDHEGDGIRNGSGWIKPDDGLLVWDRNGNGVIDDGAELFGDMFQFYP